ncbi:MAG: GYD domain-containing protein [Methanomassiliicoccales archaeon]|nr:GYD domain-containing protein [Methanomassiliicoccales archaeon]
MVAKEGIKVREMCMTLGRYDSLWIFEAPDEKAAMKVAMAGTDLATFETLVAIPRDEAMKFFE